MPQEADGRRRTNELANDNRRKGREARVSLVRSFDRANSWCERSSRSAVHALPASRHETRSPSRENVFPPQQHCSCCQTNFMGIKAEKSDGNNRLPDHSIPGCSRAPLALIGRRDGATAAAAATTVAARVLVYSHQVQLHLPANQCVPLVHQIEPTLQVDLLEAGVAL